MNGKVKKFLRKCASGEHYATNQLKKLWHETPRNERKRELNLEGRDANNGNSKMFNM